ncbi:Protein of unknown function [Bacillus wiedmannii]|nr:Protein of unknown function [Bacillus wiedmannii]
MSDGVNIIRDYIGLE